MAEVTCSRRALRPSQKSSTAAVTIQMAAKVRLPFSDDMMEKHPHTKFKQVMVFGICCLMIIFDIDLPTTNY